MFMEAERLSQLVEDLAIPFQESQIDYVACIDPMAGKDGKSAGQMFG